MTPLSIFDFDRTITRKGTYTPWLIFWARREAPWRLALLPVAVLYGLGYFCRLVSRGRRKELNQSLLMGRSVPLARGAAVAEAYAAQVCQRNVFAGALDRLAIERAEGRRIVLATASFAFYVEAIAARLGIADVIATRSVIEGDRLVARIDGEN